MATYKEVALMLFALLMQQDPKNFQDTVRTINRENLLGEYDFIIVGGGSAGATLANRLSEVKEWNVLLIEAGGQENAFTKTPAMYAAVQQSPYDWNYRTTKQRKTCKSTDGQCNFPRGKVLGGSSSINAMIYTRGYKSDYDKWGRDNCGWSFQDVKPYFIQSEGNRIPGLVNHGRRGPLTVSYPPYSSPIRDDILKAGLTKGLKYADCPDYENDCIYLTQTTIRKGRRCSSSTAYLESISDKRSNLHVLTDAYVLKIIIEDRVATGVELIKEGEKLRISARREVLLSAGSINSPKVLMLSGIGHKAHLESLGIAVLADLPVGDNLQDHNKVPLRFRVNNGSVPNANTLADPTTQLQYVQNQTGPLSYTGLEVLAFVKRGIEKEAKSGPPNIQYHITNLIAEEDYNVVVTTTNLKPKSRGTIRLNSSNPLDDPLIDVNYYDDPRDWQVTLDGMKYAYELFQSKPLKARGAKLTKVIYTYCSNEEDLSRYFNCLIEHYTGTMYHPVGTVKMAPKNENGVVNANLQVYGIRRLRVIDASIPPEVISMNTNAMAIMIGEKGADLIKAAYGKTTRQKIKVCTVVQNVLHNVFGHFLPI